MTFSTKSVLATIQAKGTGLQQPRRIPPAPTPYRPQPVPKVLQTKLSASHQPLNQQTRTPVAPPVYRPQLNKFAQPKMAPTAQSHKTPTAPPVYQPNSPMQLKPAMPPAHRPALAASPFRPAQAPYRPQPLPAVLQNKMGGPPETGQSRPLPSPPPAYRPNLKTPTAPAKAFMNPLSVQRMKIRGSDTAAVVSGTTHDKHVVAANAQQAAAVGAYLHSTFVVSDAALTDAVNANNHDFNEGNGVKSARFDFDANIAISQYDKTEGPGQDKPVSKTIDNNATLCEIGVVKTGDDRIQVTHFRKK